VSRWRGWVLGIVFAVPLALGLGLAQAQAADRPGGGSSFGGGGGGFGGGGGSSFGGGSSWSSGSSSSSSYSGGGDVGPIGMLTMVLTMGFFVVYHSVQAFTKKDAWQSGGGDHADYGNLFPNNPRFKPLPISLAPLRNDDPNFSQILLEDFLYELYARAQEARESADGLAHLAPYLSPKVRETLLRRGGRTVLAVGGVIVGAMKIAKFEMNNGWTAIEVEYETNYTETYPSSQGQGRLGFYAKERWHFVRKQGAQSRKPDEVRGFNCPSCGAPVDDDQYEACGSCGAKHGTGEFHWLCNGIRLVCEENRGPALTSYAAEVGTFDLTLVNPKVDEHIAALKEHDPEFDATQMLARLDMIYHELNSAWSSLDWDDAKPFLSDRLWLSMRYWIHAYEEQDLQNLMLGAKIDRTQIAKVEVDPFFHSITVRLWASALDHTIHRGTGMVVCGQANQPRAYSEYWTFIRSAKRKGKAMVEKNCPNCGAGLKISMAGNCEYCEVKITGGAFDWVLSKIEQDEAYLG